MLNVIQYFSLSKFSNIFVEVAFQFCGLLTGLRALTRLCTDLGLKEASDYSTELRKLEQAQNEANQETKRTGTSRRCCPTRLSRNFCSSKLFFILRRDVQQ